METSKRRVRMRTVFGMNVMTTGFKLGESYSTGWSANALLTARSAKDQPLSGEQMLGVVATHGVQAGFPVVAELVFHGGPFDGIVIRSWPCMITNVLPEAIGRNSAACRVTLVDPITYLAKRPLWGVYRGASPAELVGGAISLAAGGNGKPATDIWRQGLPRIRILPGYRSAIEIVPYAIAAGETLGEWLASVLSGLGLRAELEGMLDDDSVLLSLRDTLPVATPRTMLLLDDDVEEFPVDTSDFGPIAIRGHAAFPGMDLRAGLLDDPTKGSARPVANLGAVGHVFSESELNVEEATERLYREVMGRYAEMLMLRAVSRQPDLRPGSVIEFSREVYGTKTWQVGSVLHTMRGDIYDNDMTLMVGTTGWYPPLPLAEPARFVSAMVDGGDDYAYLQPVPRDRLGRVKVTFVFNPSVVGLEALEVAYGDRDGDREVTLADFTQEEEEDFDDNRETYDEKVDSLLRGEFADPYPGRDDADLSEDELVERQRLAAEREKVFLYMGYRRAKDELEADRDRDGLVSKRDALVSEELSEALADPTRRAELEAEWQAYAATVQTSGDDPGDDTGESAELPEVDPLAIEYGRLFGDESLLDPETDADVIAARRDAEIEPDRWPPRIALPVLQPTAGALHGAVSSHRQGDMLRVAVHGPFSAEIVGSQYRDDRRVNPDLQKAVAGVVAEHNFGQQWTGIVFRPIEQIEMEKHDDEAAKAIKHETEHGVQSVSSSAESEDETGDAGDESS